MRAGSPRCFGRGLAALIVAAVLCVALVGARGVCRAADGPAAADQHRTDFLARYEAVKYLVSMGDLKEANSQIKKLKRQAKGDAEKALAEEALAAYYLARRELSQAEKHATAALDLNPAFAVGFRTRARVRLERGNIRGAEGDFRSALSFDGSDTKSLRGLAEMYIARERWRDALPLLDRYLEVDSLDAWAQDSWTRVKAVELGYDSFPLEYLRCLRSGSVTRGELAAILEVGVETVEALRDSSRLGRAPGGGPRAAGATSPAGAGVRCAECAGRWYASFVEKCLARGVLRTFPDGSFRPDDAVTKGLLANDAYCFLMKEAPADVEAVLVRPMEVPYVARAGQDAPKVPGAGYSDVYILSYLWRPVRVSVELGLLEPESDSAFGVDSAVSGREAARMAEGLGRLLQ